MTNIWITYVLSIKLIRKNNYYDSDELNQTLIRNPIG